MLTRLENSRYLLGALGVRDGEGGGGEIWGKNRNKAEIYYITNQEFH